MFMLAGCGQSGKDVSIPVSDDKVQTTTETDVPETVPDDKQDEDTGNSAGNGDKNEDEEEKPAPVDEKPAEPEKPKPERLDTKALDKLDNTKYSWWIKLNKENKPTEIPDIAKRLLPAYDGIYIGNTSEKVVYLTFDEGYENGYTPMILDTLKANDTKALFFVTGPYIRKNADLVQRMLDEGHQVGSHTINHPSLPEVDYRTLENELLGLEREFKEKFGVGFKYMRPPMGEYSERVLAAAQQLGYKTVFWSFAYRDYEVDKQQGPDYAYKMVMDNLHNGAVILLHAVSSDNAQALDRIIKDIKAKGYEIRPFDL